MASLRKTIRKPSTIVLGYAMTILDADSFPRILVSLQFHSRMTASSEAPFPGSRGGSPTLRTLVLKATTLPSRAKILRRRPIGQVRIRDIC